jgi:hypothetical protein
MQNQMLTKLCPLLIILALSLGGCHVDSTEYSLQGTATCGGGKGCSGSVTGGVKVIVKNLAPVNLSTASSAGYAVVISVPSSELTLSSTGTAQTTLTATTDTGYTSSIVVDMAPAGSATSTSLDGYTAYTFNVLPSDALTKWVNTINSNTTDSSTIVSANSAAFTSAGQEGTYTVYAQISSLAGDTPSVSAVFADPGITRTSSTCINRTACPNLE